MDPPALDNRTDFKVLPQPLLDRDGDRLAVIVKATLGLGPDGVLDPLPKSRQRAIRSADIPWGEPEKSSILYPSDLCLRKPGTDVLVVARAFAPQGTAVPTFDVAVQVGPLKKYLRIFGMRVWQAKGSGMSSPRPMTELDVRYDHAWGGFDDSDPTEIVEEPRNPVGMGIARDPNALTHQPAPRIEDIESPISSARARPRPGGIGAIGRHWEPRRKYMGTFDARWLEERAPLLPLDFDDRANHCATPDLVADKPLLGDEKVALLNLVPGGGATTFALAKLGIAIEFRVKDRPTEVFAPHIDTILIDVHPDKPEPFPVVEYVWRASVKAPRRMKDARVIVHERSAV